MRLHPPPGLDEPPCDQTLKNINLFQLQDVFMLSRSVGCRFGSAPEESHQLRRDQEVHFVPSLKICTNTLRYKISRDISCCGDSAHARVSLTATSAHAGRRYALHPRIDTNCHPKRIRFKQRSRTEHGGLVVRLRARSHTSLSLGGLSVSSSEQKHKE